MTTPAISPYVPYYAETQPYITVAEFLAAPTGVDSSQLIPGGSALQNQAALTTLIASASNYADSLCYQVLAATSDIQVGEYRLFSDGTIRVPLAYTPIIEVTGVRMGWQSNALTTLTDLSAIWFDRKTIRIPVAAMTQLPLVPPVTVASGWGRMFAQVTYVNGYANTTLAGNVPAGATAITVTSALGVLPGMPLTVIDDTEAATEHVTVAAGYTPGSTTVPLAAALVNAHTGGVAVSALPRAIKQAVICLTAHLVKTRGAESLAMGTVSGGPAGIEKELPGASQEYEQAVDLLHPFRRVW